jgi:two-component system aerobic respiration control sensor histidine kinase ArcB
MIQTVVEFVFAIALCINAFLLILPTIRRYKEKKRSASNNSSLSFEEMRQQLYMLDSIIALMPGHVYWKDRNGAILGCNQQQAIDFGLTTRQEVVGKNAYDLMNKNLPAEIERRNAKAIVMADEEIMASGISRIIEEPALRLDGKEVIYLSEKNPLYDAEGKVIGLLGISVDITELKEARKQAEAANKAKSDFIQNMQHDIRTPLASIMVLLQTLKEHNMNAEIREPFTLLEQVCQQLIDLCRNFSKANLNEGGEEPLKRQEINMLDIAKDSISIHKPTAANKSITLDLHIQDNIPTTIVSDEFRLRRILLNLLGNAIKFTDKGKVSLTIGMDKNHQGEALLALKVSDTGIGISQDKLPFVFDKYVRDETRDAQKYPGTGLGLYFAKKYVGDLGGTLLVESELGKGSIFFAIIPTHHASKATTLPPVLEEGYV